MAPSPSQTVSKSLRAYRKFIEETTFHPQFLRCLFVNAYNYFLSGKILAEKGLITQSYNCLRMGLESEWLGLILMKDPELGMEWAFGLGDEAVLKRLKELEKPYMIRKTLGDTPRITVKDRDEIYAALSDKSHTKISSITRLFIPPNAHISDGSVDRIPIGGIQGKNNIPRILRGTAIALRFALADIEDGFGQRLMEEEWTWRRADLVKITEAGYKLEDGTFESHISSKGRPGTDPIQAVALLSAIRHGRF
jgi:hypothetical protein